MPRSARADRKLVELSDLLARGEPPAFATDARDRVIFWNRGAERLLGRPAVEVLGHPCHEIVGGRDAYGNRYCHEHCSVVAMARRGEPVQAFEMRLPQLADRALHVTILYVPGSRPELFTIVHLLAAYDEKGRLARALEGLHVRRAAAERVPPGAATPPPALTHDAPLAGREREVLGCVAAGLQNKEIAERLGISVATVRNHVQSILAKLNVHSKLEAVSLAFHQGWVSLDPR